MDFRSTVTFTMIDTIVIRVYYAELNSHCYCNTLYATSFSSSLTFLSLEY